MSETALARSICVSLQRAGVWCFVVNSGTFRGVGGYVTGAPRGTPDICVVSPPGWLEVKVPTARGRRRSNPETEAAQKRWRARAAKCGVRVEVVTSASDAVRLVAEWIACEHLRAP